MCSVLWGDDMGYRIVYGESSWKNRKNSAANSRLKILTAVFLLFFTLAVKRYWPQGVSVLQESFLPGQPGVTEQAASDFYRQIRDGIGFEDALRTFCLEILEHGESD